MVDAESPLPDTNTLARTKHSGSDAAPLQDDQPTAGADAENGSSGANGLATDEREANSQEPGSGPRDELASAEGEERKGLKESGGDSPSVVKEKSKREHDKKGEVGRERGAKGLRDRSRARSRARDSRGDHSTRRGRTMARERDRKSEEGRSKRSKEKRYSQRSRSDSRGGQVWKSHRRSQERRVGGDRYGWKRIRRSSSELRHKSRSVSRREHRRSRSRSQKRSRSASGDYGGYIPRRRQEAPLPGGGSSNEPLVQNPPGNCVTEDQALRQWREQQLRSRQLILQQAVSAQVYVGNLVPGLVSEAALRQLFNSALSAVFPDSLQPGMQPVISVSMHSDGRYAFVELRTPEMATDALQLSGQVQLFGQSISVGRPSGYVDPGKAAAAAQAAAAALAAFQAADPTASSQVPGGQGQLGMVQIGMLTGTALAASPASAFICVEGMLTLDTLTSDATYRKIIADLRNECVKHGAVIQLKIPRPADPKMAQVLFSTGFYGKAFVQFSDATAATRAREGLNGHDVQGRTLTVAFVSQEVFAAII